MSFAAKWNTRPGERLNPWTDVTAIIFSQLQTGWLLQIKIQRCFYCPSCWGNNWLAWEERPHQESPSTYPRKGLVGESPVGRWALPGCRSILVLMPEWLWEAYSSRPHVAPTPLCFSWPRHVKGRGTSERNKSWVSALLKTTGRPRRTQPLRPKPCFLPACSTSLPRSPAPPASALWADGDQELIISLRQARWLEHFQVQTSSFRASPDQVSHRVGPPTPSHHEQKVIYLPISDFT